jgi:hypothetical protein
LIQNLKELAIIHNYIIILSIDPSILDIQELRLLEKDTAEVEPSHKSGLPEDLMDILKFTYHQNIIGIKPSYTMIGDELGLCKPTARKRIRRLLSTGYIIENTKGRTKVLELNERGKKIFLK